MRETKNESVREGDPPDANLRWYVVTSRGLEMSINFVTLNQRLRVALTKVAAGSGFRGLWIPLGGFLGFQLESTLP
jgi:hypothetical protein